MRFSFLIALTFVSTNVLACIDGKGIGTNSIEINFKIPADSEAYAIFRDGVEIARYSGSLHVSSHIDNHGLDEGYTYEYQCRSYTNNAWIKDGVSLQIATLAVNAPVFEGIKSLTRYIGGDLEISWERSYSDIPVRTHTYRILAYDNSNLYQENLIYQQEFLNDDFVNSQKIENIFDEYENVYFLVRACSYAYICENNFAFIEL